MTLALKKRNIESNFQDALLRDHMGNTSLTEECEHVCYKKLNIVKHTSWHLPDIERPNTRNACIHERSNLHHTRERRSLYQLIQIPNNLRVSISSQLWNLN